MGEEKQPEEQEEEEGSEGESTEEVAQEEASQEKGEKDSNSLVGRLNAKFVAVIAASLIVGIVVGQVALPGLGVGLIALPSAGADESANTDLIALQAKVQDYLQENIMESQGFEVEVKSIEPFNELFYIVNFEVSKEGLTQDGAVFLTKDGKAIIGNEPLMLDEPIEFPESPSQSQPAEVQKSDKPTVEVFVMSYCPYGLQMQKALLPVMKLLGEKADISIKFCDYAMQDWKEIEENTRQYCIQKEQNEKYFNYLNCFVVSDDSVACLESAEIETEKLGRCITAADQEFGITDAYEDRASWLSGSFPVYNVHKELNEKYGVTGSPALVINGAQVNAGRSPEAVKQVICDAFNEAPPECSQTLSAEIASPGIGGGTGTSSDGYC